MTWKKLETRAPTPTAVPPEVERLVDTLMEAQKVRASTLYGEFGEFRPTPSFPPTGCEFYDSERFLRLYWTNRQLLPPALRPKLDRMRTLMGRRRRRRLTWAERREHRALSVERGPRGSFGVSKVLETWWGVVISLPISRPFWKHIAEAFKDFMPSPSGPTGKIYYQDYPSFYGKDSDRG